MSDQPTKRKSFSKKERFEIFKRDNFTCQYCGQEAPDVILEVDHIKPLAENGSNDLTNLITSCRDCNRGKGPKKLDDDSEVKKQKKQLEELNERKKQLEMMAEWREELLDLKEKKIELLTDYWKKMTGKFNLNGKARHELGKLLDSHPIERIMDAIEININKYLEYSPENIMPTRESADRAFSKLSGTCYLKKQSKENPHISKLHYCKGILRNRLGYFDKTKAMKWMSMAYDKGTPLEEIQMVTEECKNWTDFREWIFEYINGSDQK